ncbi:FtsX-like permease family protein [Sphingomonas sp.]|uniref:cell division protein FtsX n=1 Tax=Sphingomonas sp. TaxID=28214 RepID=UPI002B91BCCB|nr:FtsX-like permease family protein [Sphingomonas sp.]HTG39011.1 FtsX-like permease family protein [Sphingomonas sp.]
MSRSSGERRWLDDARTMRAMRWIMAIMLFLTVLAAALGLSTWRATRALDAELAGRLTVQLVDGDAAGAERLVARLRATPQVSRVEQVDRARLARLLEPWLGEAGLDADLPMPAMIDVDLTDPAAIGAVEQVVRAAAPQAGIDRHATWMAPVRGFIATLAALAAGLVLLVASATAAVVLLAARAGLDTHAGTIEVLHMLGSTDVQVARLFQRRIAIDTLAGGVVGTLAGLAFVAFLGTRIGALEAEVVRGIGLRAGDWAVIAVLPLAFTLTATLAARVAVLRTLGRRM